MIRILVPLDGSRLAELALPHAIGIARSFKARICLLQVICPSSSSGDVVLESADMRMQAAQARAYLDEICQREAAPGVELGFEVCEGRAAEEIVNYVKANDIDLVAMTAYGKGGVTEFVHGSTVFKVISGVGVSILLVRPDGEPRFDHYRKLLVPLDGSYRTDWALCLATSIARTHGAELMLLQVVQTPRLSRSRPASRQERELLERLGEIQKSDALNHLRELESRLPPELKFSSEVVVAEEAARVIAEMARSEDVGLLVLNAHGLTDSDSWLYGPVSETLLAHSTRPLLVLQDNLTSSKIEFEPHADPLAASG